MCSRPSLRTSDPCWSPSPIRFACSLGVTLLGLAPAAAVGQDEIVVDQLAAVLAAEDARRYDAAVFEVAARSADPILQRRAALAVGRVGAEDGIQLLLELLVDPDSTVRREAAFALGLIGAPEAVSGLQQEIVFSSTGGAAEGGLEAVTAVAKIGGPEAAAILGDLLASSTGPLMSEDQTSRVAERAVAESWRLGPDAPVTTLTQLAGAPSATVRRAAVYSLARLRAVEAASVFLNAANDEDPMVRSYGARVLTASYADSARLGRGPVAAVVSRLTEDENAGVRTQALQALATYRDSTRTGVAADRMTDPDDNVRVQALAALGHLGGDEAVRILVAHTGDRQFAIGRQALLSLVRIDRTRGIRKAAAWITSLDWRKRMVGAEALGTLGGDTALTWLESLIDDSDFRVAAHAYQTLIVADSVAALDYARDLLRYTDPVIRTLAARQLARAPTIADIPMLTAAYGRAETDPIPDPAIAVVEALGALAALGPSQSFAVEDGFVASVPTCDDYVVRQAAEEHLPVAAARWGSPYPVETGRTIEDYRDIVRRLLLPAEREGRRPAIVLETDRGDMVITLLADAAPLTVNALLELVDRGYFNGHRWHRVVPDFVIQDGDPRGDGWGGPGFALRDEINRQRYARGTVGMALSGRDTGGSQFFVTLAPQPHLDGSYTVFGTVTEGMDALSTTTQSDRIRTVRRQ
jgi:cyclophilin family peptidyl-prolyl cis-trans isomerase/HEAT repeat protein